MVRGDWFLQLLCEANDFAAVPSYNEHVDGADDCIEQSAAMVDGGGLCAAGVVGGVSAETGWGAGQDAGERYCSDDTQCSE